MGIYSDVIFAEALRSFYAEWAPAPLSRARASFVPYTLSAF